MAKIDIEQLRLEIRGKNGKGGGLSRWSELYITLKKELSSLNFWRKPIEIEEVRELVKDNINKRYSPITKMLKEELKIAGHWRDKPRGNPSLGGKISYANRKKRDK